MAAPTNPQEDVFAPVAQLLESATSVKSFFGAKHLSSNGSPPRYVWVPTSGTVGGGMTIGGYPRNLVDVAMVFDVHCWHKTFDLAWALAVNLISACYQVDGIHFEVGGIDASPSDDSLQGWVLTVPLQVRVPIFEADLDKPAFMPVVIQDVALDDSQGIDGDGELTAPLK